MREVVDFPVLDRASLLCTFYIFLAVKLVWDNILLILSRPCDRKTVQPPKISSIHPLVIELVPELPENILNVDAQRSMGGVGTTTIGALWSWEDWSVQTINCY